jgi:hypothetical protein
MTKRGGRPTVITDKVLGELKTAFSMDCTDKEACIFAGISEKTLYNHQKTHPKFLQEKELWKADLILKARIAVSERLEKDAWFALKYLCKKLPHEFYTPSRGSYRPSTESSEELRASLERTDKLLKEYGI